MESPRRALISQVVDYVKALRFPWLLAVTAAVLLIDVLAIDPLPFIDEIALALMAAVLASLKKRRDVSRAENPDADGVRPIDGHS